MTIFTSAKNPAVAVGDLVGGAVDATRPLSLRKKLKAATCALLAVTALEVSAQPTSDVKEVSPRNSYKHKSRPWKYDMALLYYQEQGRVRALEPVFNARREFDDEEFLNLRFVIDSLSGPSHNGATATSTEQTFTRPSGSGGYTVKPGELPLDDTFGDMRYAAHVNWDQRLGEMTTGGVGAHFSSEYDYRSLGLNSNLARDLHGRLTTLNFAFALSYDQSKPEGGIPVPYAAMAARGNPPPRVGDSEEELVSDVLFGVTRVLSRQTLMQWNYSLSYSDGYLTDPFKLLSVVDDTPGAAAGGTLGDTTAYVFEKRPSSRTKNALYWLAKHHLEKDIVDFSYRYLWDTWGIESHTFDLHYRWQSTAKSRDYWEPHLRVYRQLPASFYRHSLTQSAALPAYASADYRLGDMTAYTMGAKYGESFRDGTSYSVRLEYYLQTGHPHPDDGIGSQRTQDLYPAVKAVMLQLIYSQ